MTTWTSTMGAPLTADEEDGISGAWFYLRDRQNKALPHAEPLEMLNHCTDLIMAIYEVRKAINTAWNDANARRWPTPPREAKPRRPPTLVALALDDPVELHTILSELFGETP